MTFTPAEQHELDVTKKLLASLLRHKEVWGIGSIYDKDGFVMSSSDMAIAVNCLNRLKFKIGEYVCKVERVDAGGSPTWALV